jgi:hypothetical protein
MLELMGVVGRWLLAVRQSDQPSTDIVRPATNDRRHGAEKF